MLALLLIIQISISSCEHDILSQAEDMISAYDFNTALELLESLDTTEAEPVRLFQLRGFTYLVEGDFDEGFDDILKAETLIQAPPYPRYETAQVLFNAAIVIIREKNRTGEAMRILDSVFVRDPSLEEPLKMLVWKRALEYLDVPGDAGYNLIQYYKKKDPNVVGRLSGYNRILSNRYREMEIVDRKLQSIYQASGEFKRTKKRFPYSLRELSESRLGVHIDTAQAGWVFRMEVVDDSLLVTGEALGNKKSGILAGTVFKAADE